MKVKIQKISGTVLYVILAVTLVILGLFFFGGEDQTQIAGASEMSQPTYTDPLIYWIYILMGVTVCVTVVAAILKLVSNFIDSPKEAIKSLVGIIALVILLFVAWSMGSGEALNLPGYEGTDNVPFWLKLTDMFLYSIYFMMGVLILLIFGFSIRKKFM